ncbi:MAG: hypothetical protein R3C11_03460 [Planctomycetaceae bacterium]
MWIDNELENQVDVKADNGFSHKVAHLINVFEQLVVPELIPWLGEVSDLDRDGKFSIVLTNQLNQLATEKTPLTGLTWSGDYRRELGPPFGNQADLLYLNPVEASEELLTEVLIHEYVHALSFDLHLKSSNKPGYQQFEEDWLNEALAHVVETRLSGTHFNIQDRLKIYESHQGQYPLVVPDYYRSRLWRSDGCRGATFSFLNWCAGESDSDFLPRLLHADQHGIRNIENACGQNFSELFRRWSIAVAQEATNATSINPEEVHSWNQAATSWSLFRLQKADTERILVRIKNESESGIQLTLIPLSDPKAEEALIY